MHTFEYGLVPHCVVGVVMAGLMLLEPDFGTAMLVAGLLAFLLFVGGVPVRLLVLPLVAAVPLVAYAVMTHAYRLRRVLK